MRVDVHGELLANRSGCAFKEPGFLSSLLTKTNPSPSFPPVWEQGEGTDQEGCWGTWIHLLPSLGDSEGRISGISSPSAFSYLHQHRMRGEIPNQSLAKLQSPRGDRHPKLSDNKPLIEGHHPGTRTSAHSRGTPTGVCGTAPLIREAGSSSVQ